jgi:sugar phosphate isomerase/epimerase
MAKFGIITDASKDILKEIRTIRSLGADFVEIAMEGPGGSAEILMKKRKQIMKLLKCFDAPAIAHTPYYTELGTPFENIRIAWVAEGKRMIDIAKALGMHNIVFHLFCSGMFICQDKSKKWVINNFIKSYKELAKYGKKNSVNVAVENSRSGIGSYEDVKYILSKTPNLNFTLDIGHAFARGGMKDIEKFIKGFGKKIEHIHIHDNHGTSDEHLPLGEGKIDFRKVVKFLKQINYDKTITIETFTSNAAKKKSLNIIKRMWE